ncbi:MAG: hypothetical protein ACREFP_12165, partial [Acetobacteraceae bacterium]
MASDSADALGSAAPAEAAPVVVVAAAVSPAVGEQAWAAREWGVLASGAVPASGPASGPAWASG